MKLLWKIFWLCISVYLIAIIITAAIVTEKSSINLLEGEVGRCLKEEEYIHSNITLYLLANKRLMKDKMDIRNYSNTIPDIFGTKDIYLELYDENKNILSKPLNETSRLKRGEIDEVLSGGRNYILRDVGGKLYIFVTDLLQIDGDEMILSYIKDITFVNEQRWNEMRLFIETGLVGFIIVAVVAAIIGKIFLRPVETLSKAAKKISSGNYKERVNIKGKDEIGILAVQFNVMVNELENKIEELKIEGERKQRFIDNLTHELRTPLTSIIGYSELLLNIDYSSQIFNKSLLYVNTEGKRIQKMINTLMNMILLRENEYFTEKHFIQPLFREVIDIIKVKSDEKGIKVSIEGEDILLSMDRDLLKEVFINLADNALNASEKGGCIVMGTEIINEKPSIYVKDDGKGIPKDELDKIYEPFYRIDKSRSRKAGGMGLGLSICREIVNGHDAELCIESRLGEGTIARIIF